MERKIGETFEYEGRKLKVTEEIDGCTSCYFRKYNCHNRKIIGECLYNKRSDNKGVIFIDITDESANKQQSKKEPQQKLNLCEVLRHCPKGESFYSPMFGDVTLYGTDQETKKVLVTAEDDVNCVINADGTVTFYGVTSPEVMLYPSREQRDWSKVKYEPKDVLPKTWEEFCKNNPCKKDEWFMSTDCEFYDIKEGIERHINHDRNLLPNKQAAEAHLAYMQLHQLRDVWREGWLPDWKDNLKAKYVIVMVNGEVVVHMYTTTSSFLSFQDEARAKEFLNCFKDLIEKAGDLI